MKKPLIYGCLLAAVVLLQACTNTVKYDNIPVAQTIHENLSASALPDSASELLSAMEADPQVQKATHSSRPRLALFGFINFSFDKVDLAKINDRLRSELDAANHFRFADADAMNAETKKWEDNLYLLFDDAKSGSSLASAVDADYLLVGAISNVIHTEPKEKKIYYQVSLKLLEQRTGTTIWQDQRKILKSEKEIVYGL